MTTSIESRAVSRRLKGSTVPSSPHHKLTKVRSFLELKAYFSKIEQLENSMTNSLFLICTLLDMRIQWPTQKIMTEQIVNSMSDKNNLILKSKKVSQQNCFLKTISLPEMKQELEDSMSNIKKTANKVRAKLKGDLQLLCRKYL